MRARHNRLRAPFARGISAPNARWTTTNLAEGMPGVLCAMGDRLAGASAKAVAEQLLSAAPEALVSRSTRHAARDEAADLERATAARAAERAQAAATAGRPHAAGAGTVEGVVRVVHDPASAEVEEGDILVARTTDPSWASIMFLCSALMVDIGGMLSHAAVVARELGIPCVVNTRVGSSVLRIGDRRRVDGRTGVVELLS